MFDGVNYELLKMDVANEIWGICKLSPQHGNAVMDIIGDDAYQEVMRLVRERNGDNSMDRDWIDILKEANSGYIEE